MELHRNQGRGFLQAALLGACLVATSVMAASPAEVSLTAPSVPCGASAPAAAVVAETLLVQDFTSGAASVNPCGPTAASTGFAISQPATQGLALPQVLPAATAADLATPVEAQANSVSGEVLIQAVPASVARR